ncbi:MAG: ABC transporter permease [Alistipes sp.]|nr:ABC transporter permease [Alistipes sp.]
MRRVIENEVRLILGDGGVLLLVVFAMLIYTIIYSVAYGKEVVREVSIAVVDEDHSSMSRTLVDGLRSGPDTFVAYEPTSVEEAKELFYRGKVFGIVVIPRGFERTLLMGEQADVAVILDGSHLLIYKEVLTQTTADVLVEGTVIEASRLIASGVGGEDIMGVVQPVSLDKHILYNTPQGYGSFVMPSIVVVIIQQTLIIGLAMLGVRRRTKRDILQINSYCDAIKSVVAKILVYVVIYGINLTIVLGVVWTLFGFPYNGRTIDVAILMFIYMVSVTSLSLSLSHLFKHRESPLMLLLWSSVPILLLAGVSYPKEAFPEWLYLLGRLFPSSSAVNAFVDIGTAGVSLYDVRADLYTIAVLATIYLIIAIVTEARSANKNTLRS